MAPPVQIGDLLAGRYRIERLLGVGGMGTVVAARDLTDGALRAVKIMHPEPLGSTGWAERLRREAQVGLSLRGEHAVRIHDVGGFDEGRPYLVMEHLEGCDLGKLLKQRQEPLPVSEAALYVSQACAAVAEAHALGIVHRDLKPANLFFTRRPDGTPCVKVLDFGISKLALAGGDDAAHMTKTGEVLGSPAYMAPEQIRAFSEADPRSDVWALGVILYELCTSRWPFPGKGSMELIAMVLERSPEPPRMHRAALPVELEAVLMHCLQKDPARRMPSALALQAALDPYLPGAGRAEARSSAGAMAAAAVAARPVRSLKKAQAGPSMWVVMAVAASSVTVLGLTLAAALRVPAAARPREQVVVVEEASTAPSGEPVAAATPETAAEVPAPTAAEAEEAAAPERGTAAEREARVWGRGGGALGGKAALEVGTGRRHAGDIDAMAAQRALESAAAAARRCKRGDGPTGSGRVEVAFATSGKVVTARVGAPFEGTATGRCIVAAFRGASVPPFEGSAFEASKSIVLR